MLQITAAANDFTVVFENGLDVIAKEVLWNDVRVHQVGNSYNKDNKKQDKDKHTDTLQCSIQCRTTCTATEEAEQAE